MILIISRSNRAIFSRRGPARCRKHLKFNWKNNCIDGHVPGSDVNQGQCFMGDKRDFELSYKVREHSTDLELAAYLARTEWKAIMTFQGDNIAGANYHHLTITMNALRVNAEPKKSVEDGYRMSEIVLKGYQPSSGNYIDISAQNADAGEYLTLDV